MFQQQITYLQDKFGRLVKKGNIVVSFRHRTLLQKPIEIVIGYPEILSHAQLVPPSHDSVFSVLEYSRFWSPLYRIQTAHIATGSLEYQIACRRHALLWQRMTMKLAIRTHRTIPPHQVFRALKPRKVEPSCELIPRQAISNETKPYQHFAREGLETKPKN